jgi:hypothetical protein
MAAILITGVCLLSDGKGSSQDAIKQVPQFHLAMSGEFIAGIPVEEAAKINEQYSEQLRQLPGVVSVGLFAEGLVVETVNPSALPVAVEGLPVIPIPPIDPWAGRTIDGSTPIPPREPAELSPPPAPPEVVEVPPLPDCPAGMHRNPHEVRCQFDTPPPVAAGPKVELIPPPPGVIVLKPGKVREQAEECPKGFNKVEGYGGWWFCVDPHYPEPIPPLWSPPINGVAFEDALEIHDRHASEFMQFPGVESVGLGADGIHIVTTRPELIPKEVEGVPIIVRPATGRKIKLLSHTYNNPVRPLHQAVTLTEPI